jgi:putative transposase
MKSEKKEKIAVFRFGVIFPLLENDVSEMWGEKERILRVQVSKDWNIPYSNKSYMSKATILNWYKKYLDGGKKIEALYPSDRGDKGKNRTLDEETTNALILFRKENPKISVTRLLEKAKSQKIIPPGNKVSLESVYRILRSHKLDIKKKKEDMRKFEVQMSNDLWQSDCMHGPKILHEGKMCKTYLFAIIDDHSRLIPHGQFYFKENVENYLDCFWTAMKKRGVPRKLYVDNGPSFRSHRVQLGCAAIGIGLSYARPYRPQGKGKIERYFRTVRGQFLPELPENITLDKLNDLFTHYVEDIYHKRRHGTTGETPINRYLDDGKTLRRAPDNLPDFFRKKETRIVNNDRTVKLDGQLFEAPIGLIGQQVTLRFESYDRIEVFLDEKSKGFLTLLNPAINSRVKRVIDGSEKNEDLNQKIFEKKYLKGKGLYE